MAFRVSVERHGGRSLQVPPSTPTVALAHILEERQEPSRGKRPGWPTGRRWTYRHRHIPMTEESLHKLDALVERVNQHTEKRMNQTEEVAVLLEQAVAREWGVA